MSNNHEELQLQIRPRENEIVSLNIPKDTLASLEEVAASRDMSVEALLKFYVGQGLRQDITKLFNQRLLEKTAQVLSRHIQSEEQIYIIMQEIKAETKQ